MEEAPPRPRPRPPRRVLVLLLVPIVALVVCSYIGDAAWAYLVDHHPLWLIALNSRKRYLAAVVPYTDVVSFFTVGLFRQVLSDPLFYLLGWLYGDAGIRWMERKLGDKTGSLRTMESWFRKAAYPMVAIAPNNLICLMAGAERMPPAVFLVLNVGGTVASLVLIRIFGDVFSEPIQDFFGVVGRYRWWVIGISVVLVAIQIIQGRRQGTTELESVTTLERELEEAAHEVESSEGEGDGGPTAAR